MQKKERLKLGLLKIGELAKECNLPNSTIRYYTDIGLLKVVGKTKGGYRLYDKEKSLKVISIVKPPFERRRSLIDIKKYLQNKDWE